MINKLFILHGLIAHTAWLHTGIVIKYTPVSTEPLLVVWNRTFSALWSKRVYLTGVTGYQDSVIACI